MPALGLPHSRVLPLVPHYCRYWGLLSLHQELSSTMSNPMVKNRLKFPLFLVINQDRCRFGVASPRESLIIVKKVGLDNYTVEYPSLQLIYP